VQTCALPILSSWPFTRSTLPPTLEMTGRTSRSTPLTNEERRPTVSPSRMNRYASESPTARRKTASASRHRSPQLKAATSNANPILFVPGGRHQSAADAGVALVENGGLPGGDAVSGTIELAREAVDTPRHARRNPARA